MEIITRKVIPVSYMKAKMRKKESAKGQALVTPEVQEIEDPN